MNKTMYSAFISSVYESLMDERYEVINRLLDDRIFPIGMEHFTVSSSNKFEDIKALIDISDYFILILGEQYGSADENGVAWTEREYDYAVERGMPIITVISKELGALLKLSAKEREQQAESVRKQLAFVDKVEFARKVTDDLNIYKIVGQALTNVNKDELAGWTRNSCRNAVAEKQWRDAHKSLDVGGQWFHIHFSDDDEKYIRTGTVNITQDFSSMNYKVLSLQGFNYSIKYRSDNGRIDQNILKLTKWEGAYNLTDDGGILGIFKASRGFTDNYGTIKIEKGVRRGIHDFNILDDGAYIQGNFHDEAPSPKCGRIFMFRTENQRDEFLRENFLERLLLNV